MELQDQAQVYDHKVHQKYQLTYLYQHIFYYLLWPSNGPITELENDNNWFWTAQPKFLIQ